MNTTLTTLLDIRYPIIQAPIGSASTPELAAAVSNAGGLGMLALSWSTLDEMRDLIRATKKLTSKPFGVNLVLEWNQSERVDICIQEKVHVMSFFWGDSTKFIKPLKEVGIKVCHTIGSSHEAVVYEKAGVDFIVAQGWEAGGHVWGQVASSVLIRAVTKKVSIPVVCAGGFCDGSGLLAALSLGASGIWIGTRFLMTQEANVSQTYQEIILNADDDDTVHEKRLFNVGWDFASHRVVRNSTVKLWEKAGRPEVGKRPNENEILAMNKNGIEIRRYSDDIPLRSTQGNLEALAIYAGQSVGIINHKSKKAGEIVVEIVEEASTELIRTLKSFQS